MFVYTLLNGEVAGWCHSLLLWLHCHGHGVTDNTLLKAKQEESCIE